MKFLIDAQLPRRLGRRLAELGHDVLHTLDLPEQNRTADHDLTALAMSDDRIVVTKDRDFVDSFILRRQPPQLLWVTTGNVTNQELLDRFEQQLPQLAAAFAQGSFVELSLRLLIVHE